MRVVYTHATRLAGAGIGSIAYQFLRVLHRAGVLEQAIVAYGNPGDLPPERLRVFPWMRAVAWLARDYQPLRDALFDWAASRRLPAADLFHGWSHQCLRSLGRARALGMVTVVERQNSHDLHQARLLEEEFRRWGIRRKPVWGWGMKRGLAEFAVADFITVPSPFAYESMVREGIGEDRLFLVPYGVDVERFRPPDDPPSGPFRALFVGQVSLRKGVPYLLEAWDRLRLPRAELWLAGRITPDARPVVRPYLRHPAIRFLGHVRDVPALYRQAHLFVFPSLEEGSALVTYEAMASGLPLVFTYNSGAVARDGVEGIQVPIRDVEALAAAIERVYRDPRLRRRLGEAGRRRALEHTWEAAGERLLAAYREALRRKGRWVEF